MSCRLTFLFAPLVVASTLTLASTLVPALVASAAPVGAPRAMPPVPRDPFEWSEDELEETWMWRAKLVSSGTGRAQALMGRDQTNAVVVSLLVQNGELRGTITGPKSAQPLATFASTQTSGELQIERRDGRLRVAWRGEEVADLKIDLPGTRFGTSASGKVSWEKPQMQPTEVVVFRDDFMRASGPDEPELPGEWRTVRGEWKTSGQIGARADANLHPNPFVFRARSQNGQSAVARTGRWFWSGYDVSTSIKAVENGAPQTSEPLTATLEALADEQNDANSGVRAELDFRARVARLYVGDKVVAQSEPFALETDEWHRVVLRPGPGEAKLWVDGVLRASGNVKRASGGIALRAQTGTSKDGAASHVDFDDVRAGVATTLALWGEGEGGALPSRFLDDRLMRNWANAAAAWKRDDRGAWWHTGDFFRDAKIEIPLPPLTENRGLRVHLFAAPTSVASAQTSGTALDLALAGADKLQLSLGGKTQTLSLEEGAPLVVRAERGQNGKNGRLWARSGESWVTWEVPSKADFGTKVGLVPLRDGAPLEAAGHQELSIATQTWNRDGRAVVGVNITPLFPHLAREMKLGDAHGAVVDHIEPNSPAEKAGIKIGDVVRAVNGQKVVDVDAMREAVAKAMPGQRVKLDIARPRPDGSGLEWGKISVNTNGVLDYAFTGAPTDWRAGRGVWQLAERWTCSPEWSFFAGSNDPAPLLWSRFAPRGDWTLEAYLATPMDPTRGERSPSDLNIAVGGNGRDLSQGTSFLFATENRSSNQIWHDGQPVWNANFEMAPGVGDSHQDWFYLRLEKRTVANGVRYAWSVNGRPITTWTDEKPDSKALTPLAFWTQNGALSLARVRLWHEGVEAAPAPLPTTFEAKPILHAELPTRQTQLSKNWKWSVRSNAEGAANAASARLEVVREKPQGNLQGESQREQPFLRVTNPAGGGDWTVYATREAFDPREFAALEWDYRLTPEVKVNLFVLVDGGWREIEFAAPSEADSPTQAPATPTRSRRATNVGGGNAVLGRVENVQADGQWHRARFDLLAALRERGLDSHKVEALAFAAPQRGPLWAGLSGNPAGASYALRDFRAIVYVG